MVHAQKALRAPFGKYLVNPKPLTIINKHLCINCIGTIQYMVHTEKNYLQMHIGSHTTGRVFTIDLHFLIFREAQDIKCNTVNVYKILYVNCL